MLDNAFRITIDTLYPSPSFNRSLEPIPENRFELVFHQMVDGDRSGSQAKDDLEISDTEETFPEN